ncbi:MAG: GTP-binding protein [Alphaproteobacteria bacterium]
MRQIRVEFGTDAVIVSTQQVNGNRGVRVTAAIECAEETELGAIAAAAPERTDSRAVAGSAALTEAAKEAIVRALRYHRTPRRVIERLTRAPANGTDDPLARLAALLANTYRFAWLAGAGDRTPIALVGPPGAGKTVAAAKLAARAVMARLPVRVVTTDNFRAGGVEQLAALTRVLDIGLATAGSPRELQRAAADAGESLVIVDTAGVNPFDPPALVRLAELVDAIGAEPVLTIAGGGDAGDAAETGEIFGAIGCRRMLSTRLDVARRLGGLLAAADSGELMFSDASMSPHIPRGLHPLDPRALARLLLCHQPQAEPVCPSDEASR